MRRKHWPAAAIASVILLGGCAQDAPEAEGTDDTTRSLLSQARAGAISSPVPVVGESALADGAPMLPITELGFNLGSWDAPVKVIELSDFGCGYCRQFHQATFPGLREQFIDTGMVEWKFLPFVAGMFANSLAVSEVAECTLEQGAEPYKILTDRLWEGQAEWKTSSEPETIVRPWVAELEVDMAEFDRCLADDRRIDRIAAATAFARQAGVRATPTFLVLDYGPLQGALPLDVFQEFLTAVHEDRTAGDAN